MDKAVGRQLGEFTHHTRCRFCQSQDLTKFLDFGDVPLAGGFLKPERIAEEKFYPLALHFCRNCALVQVTDAVSVETLFKNYFYFSSAIQTLVQHFTELASELADGVCAHKQSLAVEIGCNDGVLIKPLLARGIKAIGVDPATNVVQTSGLPPSRIINDCFTEALALQIRKQHGAADAILSSFSFAHIDDMVDVMKGVRGLLKQDGVFIFEVYYLGIMLDELQYDMMYHEHMSYYSLQALVRFFERFGMEIFDVRRSPLRAGTMRFYSQVKSGRSQPVTPAVAELLDYERRGRLDSVQTYLEFAQKVAHTKRQLRGLLEQLKWQGRKVIGYGASGRATTIMTYCGIDRRYLDYVVDDAPAKHGFCTPGTHVPIKPWSAAQTNPPDYALVFAWSFIDEVKRRRMDYLQAGGKFIIPLPEVAVMGA
jgi:methylation protein EvaC